MEFDTRTWQSFVGCVQDMNEDAGAEALLDLAQRYDSLDYKTREGIDLVMTAVTGGSLEEFLETTLNDDWEPETA
jgi:hypothetical protein